MNDKTRTMIGVFAVAVGAASGVYIALKGDAERAEGAAWLGLAAGAVMTARNGKDKGPALR